MATKNITIHNSVKVGLIRVFNELLRTNNTQKGVVIGTADDMLRDIATINKQFGKASPFQFSRATARPTWTVRQFLNHFGVKSEIRTIHDPKTKRVHKMLVIPDDQ